MSQQPRTPSVEWPTLALAVLIHVGWLAVTWWHSQIGVPLTAIVGSILVAWHGSLQHEVIHDHPTRHRWLNDAVGALPVSLWLPYQTYRRLHIAHHRTPALTDPLDDTESMYLARPAAVNLTLAALESSLIGRLVFGPIIRIPRFWLSELARVPHEPLAVAREWLPHFVGVALVVGWLQWCHFSVPAYIALCVYPGTALSLVRSYAEHRTDADPHSRSAIVEHGGLLGWLFLFNNLHAVHHAHPGLAWYQLPAAWRAERERYHAAPYYHSYLTVIRKFALRQHDQLVHPDYR